MTRSQKYALSILVILIIIGVLILVELNTHFIKRFISDVVYDNRIQDLSCEELPTLADVEQVMEEHQDVIQQIENINPGFIRVYIDTSCPGKGSLIIEYPSHSDRLRIEALIGDTFFGIPWKGINT